MPAQPIDELEFVENRKLDFFGEGAQKDGSEVLEHDFLQERVYIGQFLELFVSVEPSGVVDQLRTHESGDVEMYTRSEYAVNL
jgi:hypothetical protein